MEEKWNEREDNGRDEGSNENVGHSLSDWSMGPVRKLTEDREKDKGRKVICSHDYSHNPLDIKNLMAIARKLKLCRGDAIHSSGKYICKEGWTP